MLTVRSASKCLNRGRAFHDQIDNAKMLVKHSVSFYDELLCSDQLESNLAARCRTPVVDPAVMRELLRIYRKAESRGRFKKLEECNPYEKRQSHSSEVSTKHLKLSVFKYVSTLPNKLNERTPCGSEDTVIHTKSFDAPVDAEDHISVGERLNVLRYEDKVTYYLENDAAKLEQAVVRYLSNMLQNERKFKPFRNPDTCNSFVLEGVVVDELPKHGIQLRDDFLTLTGGASLASFCALRVDTSTHKKFMPERFFTCARHYGPALESHGLFGVFQRTDVGVFVATSTADEMWTEFEALLRWMVELYEGLGLDFRVCYRRAAGLTLAECCRATIQLYSAHEKRFVDGARVSVYDTFVSNRLRILCHNAKRERGLVYIVDGVVVSVPTLVACLLERSTDRLFIPDCIRPFMPK